MFFLAHRVSLFCQKLFGLFKCNDKFFGLLKVIVISIYNKFGQGIHSLSGPVDYEGANGAEVNAMLIGCCELCKIEVRNAIVLGDSFLAN